MSVDSGCNTPPQPHLEGRTGHHCGGRKPLHYRRCAKRLCGAPKIRHIRFWRRLRVDSGSTRGRFGLDLASTPGRLGVDWHRFGIDSGQPGVDLQVILMFISTFRTKKKAACGALQHGAAINCSKMSISFSSSDRMAMTSPRGHLEPPRFEVASTT